MNRKGRGVGCQCLHNTLDEHRGIDSMVNIRGIHISLIILCKTYFGGTLQR